MKYDPHHDIDAKAWTALDESEQIDAVSEYHRRKKVQLPNNTIHATIHVIVENQVALGDSYPAKAVLTRLMNEGLDRHEAIHAIGSVLSERLLNALTKKGEGAQVNAEYEEKLKNLTAESWRKQFS